MALNPFVFSAFLLLLINRCKGKKIVAYVAGWVVGLGLLVLFIYYFLEAKRTIDLFIPLPNGKLQIILGLLFLAGAAYQFRSMRGKKAHEPLRIKWIEKVDVLSSLGIFGLAFFMAGINLKNAGLVLSALLSLWEFSLFDKNYGMVLILFVVIGSLAVFIPALFRLVKGPAASDELRTWLDWALTNYRLVLFIIALFFGVKLTLSGLMVYF